MTLGFHLKAYYLSRKSLLKPSDLEGKSSASWPEGNFFLLFTSLWEAAAQTHYCLESRAHKTGGWGWSRAEGGRKKIIKKKRFRAEAERKSEYCILWCKLHAGMCVKKCMIKTWPKIHPISTSLVFMGPDPCNFPWWYNLLYGNHLS